MQECIALRKARSVNVNIIAMIFIATIFVQELKSHPACSQPVDNYRAEIDAINKDIEHLYVTEDFSTIAGLYAEEFSFFPEYKPAILEINTFKKFLIDWFEGADIKTYKKSIYAVEVYSGYVLEMGTFQMNYSSVDKEPLTYEGHYMILWKRNGGLRIVSETFGANKYIEPHEVPYAGVNVQRSTVSPIPSISNQLYSEVLAFDSIVLKAVATGDGEARASGFTEDAILMSNFDSIRVGMDTIRPKMLKTYNRNVSFNVAHTYFRIYDLGEYVFATSHYKGGWGDNNSGGRFEGNMSNLMKRNQTGKLLMHRQIGNRDSELVTAER